MWQIAILLQGLWSDCKIIILYHLIANASSWNSLISVSEAVKRELGFLFDHLELLNGFPIRPTLSASPLQFKFCSDASDIGNCVYEIIESENVVLS